MILDKDGILKKLLVADQRAAKVARAMTEDEVSGEAFGALMGEYIRIRFMLDEETGNLPKDLNKLAELSVARAMKLNPDEADLLDVSQHCGATSSAMTKKALLYMNLEEALGFRFGELDPSEFETVEDLALAVQPLLEKGGQDA